MTNERENAAPGARTAFPAFFGRRRQFELHKTHVLGTHMKDRRTANTSPPVVYYTCDRVVFTRIAMFVFLRFFSIRKRNNYVGRIILLPLLQLTAAAAAYLPIPDLPSTGGDISETGSTSSHRVSCIWKISKRTRTHVATTQRN